MKWYSQKLIEHGRNVLHIAREIFPKTKLSGKVAGIHWQYLHHTRCAETTAGYYNTSYYSTYSKIAEMFKENDVNFCFTCLEMNGRNYEATSDPESLVSDVFQVSQKYGLNFEGENALERYDWDAYNQILKWKSKGLCEFTFLRMSKKLLEDKNIWRDFKKFTHRMHGETFYEDKDFEEEKENDEKENKIVYNIYI